MLSFSKPVFRYSESREIGPAVPERVIVGIRSVTVHCDRCSRTWVARPHDGYALPVIGGLSVECSGCGDDGITNLSADR